MIRVVAWAFFILPVFLLLQMPFVFAQDMRASHVKNREALYRLEKKAASEKEDAIREARREHDAMMQSRELLEKKLADLRKRNSILRDEVTSLSNEAVSLEQREKEISTQLDSAAEVVHELIGVVRINAKDINTLVEQNHQTALFKPDTAFLQDLLQQTQFPGMDDVRRMVELLKDQISQTGWVILRDGTLVGRDGRETRGRILLVGPFTAAYSQADETGFLVYNSSSRQFYAVSKPPPLGMRNTLKQYMQGESDDVPVDISRGGAVRELTTSRNLWEQVKNGGPVVWPILGVFAAGILIMLERIIFLLRSRVDSKGMLHLIENAVSNGQWEEAENICRKSGDKPLARILLSGLGSRSMGREEMENALQEAILSEIPALERFLSALGMLAAIAPLLGLLGTVTGMINTFHVITLHGTGDPRLMSGGISEALVTTMLGLSAAIPLLMGHNLLGSVVDKRIADMEEKSVALVNIILKARESGGKY